MWKFAAIAGLALVTPLGACVDDGYGGGVALGYDDGWDPYYGGFSADPYWGWYGDYYYPGTGLYVYDAQRHRHRWDGAQRGYWQGRAQTWQSAHRDMRPVWRDFGHGAGGGGHFGGRPGGGHPH